MSYMIAVKYVKTTVRFRGRVLMSELVISGLALTSDWLSIQLVNS